MRVLHVALALSLVSLFACGLSQTPGARAQETANDFNSNMRFGRNEIAAEEVSSGAREHFFEQRKAWGAAIQIADSEVQSFRLKDTSHAEVQIKVAWYRQNENELRTTTLKQGWKDFKGAWKLVSEDRSEGDFGLLGDRAPTAAKVAYDNSPPHKQFDTIRLGERDDDGENYPPALPTRSDADGPPSNAPPPSPALQATPAQN